MTRIFYIITLVIFIIPSTAKASEIIAENKISKATVYTNRAKIVRTATIDAPKGDSKVVFKSLPVGLMADSLRVKGVADSKVIFGSVSHKTVMSSDFTSEKEKSLNDQLTKLQDDLDLLNVEKQALRAKQNFIDNIAKQAKLRNNEEIAEFNLHTEKWASAADVIYNGTASVGKAKKQIDFKTRKIQKEKNRIQREINQLRTGSKSVYDVTVPISSDTKGKLEIELSYQISNATWRPIYDARLNTENNGDLKIIQYGSVSQRTGEDWSNVELTLSTAQPHRGSSLPDLKPFWVNIWKPEYQRKAQREEMYFGESAGAAMSPAQMPMGVMASNMAMDSISNVIEMKRGRVKSDAAFQTANIKTGGFVSEYSIFGKNDIPADGTNIKLMIGEFDTDSIVQIHVKPQLSTKAFIVAKAKLKGENPILPGRVNLFRDGAFVGQNRFPLLRPSEEHGLYFGIDDKLAVKRKILADAKKETGMIMKDNEQERYFVTELQNLHKTPIEIVVKETIPVAKHDEIDVEIIRNKTTKGYEIDSANIKGMLRWKFKMEPKSKQDIKLGWTVSWPQDYNISGL